jgi:competence ComEA-like helix-hairpin-helix protein
MKLRDLRHNSLVRYCIALLCFLALPLAAQDELPDGKGRETLENTCTECHGLDKALATLRNRENWRTIAATMRTKGATMSDDELNTLVDYLFQNFGKDEVNVNKAPAKEIEVALEISAKDAEAIVRHRQSKGPFKSWPDVLNVAGIDKPKLVSRKERVVY